MRHASFGDKNKTCVVPAKYRSIHFTIDLHIWLFDLPGCGHWLKWSLRGSRAPCQGSIPNAACSETSWTLLTPAVTRRERYIPDLYISMDLQKFSPQINKHVSISSFVQYFHLHAWLVSRFAGRVHHLHGAQIINIRLDSNILAIHLLNEKAIYQFAFSTSAKLFVVYHPWWKLIWLLFL